MRRALSVLLLAAAACPRLRAAESQPYRLYNARAMSLRSARTGADYAVYVGLLRGYETASSSYPVVLALDADFTFPLLHSIALFLADHGELPPVIVVGIAYPGGIEQGRGPIYKLSRTRDYTPTHVAKGGYGPEFQKLSGGADRFLDFIAQELLPVLTRDYRARADDRALVGMSYGGLLACYALLTRPGLFSRYIIVSPSLWYDKRMISRVEEKTSARPDLPARAYFAVGARETGAELGSDMVGDLVSFTRTLERRRYAGYRDALWVAPEETHHSVFPAAAMRGLRWLFAP